MSEWLNLEELVRGMLDTPLIGPEHLAVWGGEFTADRLKAFLNTWNLPRDGMPWSLWQWTDDIKVQHRAGIPGDLDYLERGRIFGPDGDLELRRDWRRDGDRFLWRFVGETGTRKPQGFDVADYWTGREDKPVRPYQRTALLWGSKEAAKPYDKTGWHEDRVGRAQLDYPNVNGNRVQVRYVEYLYGGEVELVRLLCLEDEPSRPKGGDNA